MEGQTFLDINLEDAVEPKTVPEDEYLVKVNNVRMDEDKNNNPYVLLSLEIPDVPESKGFTHFIGFPHAEDNAKQKNQRKWNMKVMFDAFKFDYRNQPLENIIGAETWALVGEGDDDPEYGKQNYIRRWLGQR